MIIQDNHTIEIFKNQLPVKPYCSNNLQSGLSIRNKNRALEMLYLQANQPAIQTCLLFDLDEDNAFYKFDEVGLPVPTFITKALILVGVIMAICLKPVSVRLNTQS
jgi:hypothetical protein